MAKKATKNKPPGRPTKYRTDFIARVLRMEGLTHADMAKNLGIALSSFNAYRNMYVAFSDAIKETDTKTDNIVQSALFKRATGYSCPDTKAQWIFDKDGGGHWEYADLVKHYPPDSTALIFWLKNRDPDKWRDKHDIEHAGNIGLHPVQKQLDRLSDEQVFAIADGFVEEEKKK